MARKRHQTEDEANVDMTPMLDIVFIMLIFFIVTATFVREVGLDVSKPDSSENPPQQPDFTVLISITEDGRIFVLDREVDMRAVRANVERLLAENPDASVVVQADPQAETRLMVGVMDQARQGGAPNVSLAETN